MSLKISFKLLISTSSFKREGVPFERMASLYFFAFRIFKPLTYSYPILLKKTMNSFTWSKIEKFVGISSKHIYSQSLLEAEIKRYCFDIVYSRFHDRAIKHACSKPGILFPLFASDAVFLSSTCSCVQSHRNLQSCFSNQNNMFCHYQQLLLMSSQEITLYLPLVVAYPRNSQDRRSD